MIPFLSVRRIPAHHLFHGNRRNEIMRKYSLVTTAHVQQSFSKNERDIAYATPAAKPLIRRYNFHVAGIKFEHIGKYSIPG